MPSAPRKALGLKRRKTADVDREAVLPLLREIKAKNSSRVRELCRVALEALRELEGIELQMDREARDVCPAYLEALPDFKLTFERTPGRFADENDRDTDDDSGSLEQCAEALESMHETSLVTREAGPR